MKNILNVNKNLLKKLEDHENVILKYLDDNTTMELTYDDKLKCYRTAKEGFFKFDLIFLFEIANKKHTGVELL